MSGTIPPTIVTPDQFRIDYPEFADPITYTDARIQTFLTMGTMICAPRWGAYQVMGIELFTAHMLSLSRRNVIQSSGGGIPGSSAGATTSKSVSKVSVGYDAQLTGIANGGPWNYTIYGQEFLWWATILGTGGYETLAAASPSMVGMVWDASGVLFQGV